MASWSRSRNDEGIRALDDFIHPERRYPVIGTTSKLLSTGVDVKTCKLIVLDQSVQSMIEFKQMIGRGTRIHEETGELWFTIIDLKKVTERFSDVGFDGDPVVIYEPPEGAGPVPPPEFDDADAPAASPVSPAFCGVFRRDAFQGSLRSSRSGGLAPSRRLPALNLTRCHRRRPAARAARADLRLQGAAPRPSRAPLTLGLPPSPLTASDSPSRPDPRAAA